TIRRSLPRRGERQPDLSLSESWTAHAVWRRLEPPARWLEPHLRAIWPLGGPRLCEPRGTASLRGPTAGGPPVAERSAVSPAGRLPAGPGREHPAPEAARRHPSDSAEGGTAAPGGRAPVSVHRGRDDAVRGDRPPELHR